MADFMTVLAASQKQTAGGKQANPLASLLPERLFGSVLSAQLKRPLDEVAPALPAALADGLPIQVKPGDKTVELAAEAETDMTGEPPAVDKAIDQQVQAIQARPDASVTLGMPASRPHPAVPATLQWPASRAHPTAPATMTTMTTSATSATSATARDLAQQMLPAASAALQVTGPRRHAVVSPGSENPTPQAPSIVANTMQEVLPQALPAALPVSQEPVAETRPAALPARQGLLLAASSAGSEVMRGQELPVAGRVPLDVPAEAVMVPSVTVGATTGSPDLTVAAGLSVDAPPAPDMAGMNATRQLGQFEQAIRAPESRVQVALETPVRSQAFPAEFTEKVVWLAGRQSQWADMSLNPPQLGAIEVRLSLSGGEAGVQFFSPHPMVRDAIEAALPRLRELMAQAGIALGDAQVREEAFARREAGGSRPAGGDAIPGEASFPVAPVAMSSRAGIGLVDLYV
ncbi:MAG: flagellar hook-length control protein FliK [Pseudomonadota bacterium]|nr:flagellar hook-length control protein FliK [Pseudomonadota bacterium]